MFDRQLTSEEIRITKIFARGLVKFSRYTKNVQHLVMDDVASIVSPDDSNSEDSALCRLATFLIPIMEGPNGTTSAQT